MGFIYKVVNTINEKVYIGQTTGFVEDRFKEHKQECSKGYNPKRHFHMAMKKYGFESFTIHLLEEVPNHCLDEREIYWIAYYDSYSNGYNSTTGGQKGTRPMIPIEEIYKLHSEGLSILNIHRVTGVSRNAIEKYLKIANLQPNKHPKPKRKNSKPVICIELNIEFASLREAANYLRPNVKSSENRGLSSCIRECCNGKIKTCKGFTWKFKENENS